MKDYELLIAVSEKAGEEPGKKLLKEIEEKVEKNKGVVASVDSWGKRSLAFNINGSKNAFYHLINFSGGENLPKTISDTIRINDSVLRYIITKKEAKRFKTKVKVKKTKA